MATKHGKVAFLNIGWIINNEIKQIRCKSDSNFKYLHPEKSNKYDESSKRMLALILELTGVFYHLKYHITI